MKMYGKKINHNSCQKNEVKSLVCYVQTSTL